MKPIKIILADDHDLLREGFKALISKNKNYKVVGEARNGLEVIALAKKLMPDVFVMDIQMPKMNGVEATKEVKKLDPQAKIIALSVLDDEFALIDMLESGAIGYLVKNVDKAELFEALDTISNGHPYYCSSTTPMLLKLVAESRFNPYTHTVENPTFDKKERQVIEGICEGLSSQEIADKMLLSVRTIEGYRLQNLKEMNARNSAGIVMYSLRKGLYKIN